MTYDEMYDGRLRLYSMDMVDAQETFFHDVQKGLSGTPKVLPAKYFYDAHGSKLYERICALPEYYPYRAEHEIMATFARQIHAQIGHLPLVELGPGNASKTRYLLEQYEKTGDNFVYCPVEIERTIMLHTAGLLLADFPHLAIAALHADFAQCPEVIQQLGIDRKAIAFLGSSMGNFTTHESLAFLHRVRGMMGDEDVFLLGIDLKKTIRLLLPAYDDAQGVTAAFNLNLLRRINRELGGDFDLEAFEHVALYNESHGRIEMHLRSLRTQDISISKLAQSIHFDRGETIHTENSYKYSLTEIRSLAAQANLRLDKTWQDQQGFFLVASFCPER